MELEERIDGVIHDLNSEYEDLTAKYAELTSKLGEVIATPAELKVGEPAIPKIQDKLRQIKQGQSNSESMSLAQDVFMEINDLINRRRNYKPLVALFEEIKQGKLNLLEFTVSHVDNTHDIESLSIEFLIKEDEKVKMIFEELFGATGSNYIKIYSDKTQPNRHSVKNYSFVEFQGNCAKELSEELRFKLKDSAQGFDLEAAMLSFKDVDIDSIKDRRELLYSITEEEYLDIKLKLIQDFLLIKQHISI